MFPGKFRLHVKGDIWTTWSQDTASIPLYILDALHNSKALANTRNEITWMELIEENFRQGDTYVVDEIETEGAEMLTTKYGETEIAFAVTGRDIKCAGRKLSMIGPPRNHGQYISYIPRGLFKEQVLEHYSVDTYGERYQTKDRVRFQEPLKDISACSWMVYSRELKKAELTLSCARVPDIIAATQKLPAHLMLGMGFETKSGYYGAINQLGPDCTILKNTPLLSRNHLKQMIPNAIRELQHDYVFQTEVVSEEAIPVGSLLRVFLVQPMALQHALNTQVSTDNPRSDVFICGHIALHKPELSYQLQRFQNPACRGWQCKPIEIYGVKALSGDQVFESIYHTQRIFYNYNPESILTMIRAEVEDWLLVCASTKPEDRQVSRNTYRFQGVSALDLMATLYSKAASCQHSAKYERNALRVDFSRKKDSEEVSDLTGYEGLVDVFARDIHRTALERLGGDVLKIGQPAFKCMFLPRLEATMTVQYSELLGPGEDIVKWTNRGSAESKREFSRLIYSLKHCMHCLRRVAANPAAGNPGAPAFGPIHGCTCSQATAQTESSGSDSD